MRLPFNKDIRTNNRFLFIVTFHTLHTQLTNDLIRHGCPAVRYGSLSQNKDNMKLNPLISLIITVACIACSPDVIEATDSTLKAELEVITPVVGYGGEFSARLFTNAESIMVTAFSCDYPLLIDGSELSRYSSYSCSSSGLLLSTGRILTEEDRTESLSITVKDEHTGQIIELSCTFEVLKEQLVIPTSITPSGEEVSIAPSKNGYSSEGVTVNLSFSPQNCLKDYVLSYSRDDWRSVIDVTERDEAIEIRAPQNSVGGDVVITVTSSYNTFVSTRIRVQVRKDVALVIMGTSCGDKARVTWNQYESYLFTDLYCYIADYSGDIESVMRSSSKDASGLSFSSSQSSFDYDIEFSVKKMSGSQVKTTRFPYRCLSNAKMDLGVIRGHINSETDRKTRDHDTGYQYYTLVVSGLSYKSSIYNIRYIVHLYKAKKDGYWIACNDFSSGYDLEKNKYWYAAADTDEWIIETK